MNELPEVLSAGEMCRITGIHVNTLDRWVSVGLLKPAGSGRGKGWQRRFTLSDAAAVLAGMVYRENDAGPERVMDVVKFVARAGIAWLEQEFAAGRTVPCLPSVIKAGDWFPPMMVELKPEVLAELGPGPRYLLDRLDLRRVVARVKAAAAMLAAEVAV